jgi:hypothetical protein
MRASHLHARALPLRPTLNASTLFDDSTRGNSFIGAARGSVTPRKAACGPSSRIGTYPCKAAGARILLPERAGFTRETAAGRRRCWHRSSTPVEMWLSQIVKEPVMKLLMLLALLLALGACQGPSRFQAPQNGPFAEGGSSG